MLSSIPRIGLGTWKLTGQTCIDMVQAALRMGYQHIDTATIYENEQEVGQGWKTSGVEREKFWLTTKVWIDSFGYDDCLRSVQTSLQHLQTEYLDLVLLHWPCREKKYDHHEALDALMNLKRDGKIRNFGVSNFPISMLKEAIEYTGGQIFTNQVEYHVYLDQGKMKEVCDELGVVMEAYSPLAHGHIFKDEVLGDIAQKHGKSISQIALKYLLEQDNLVVLPKASSSDRLAENLAMEGWSLDQEDRARIAALPKTYRYCDIPGLSPKWDH